MLEVKITNIIDGAKSRVYNYFNSEYPGLKYPSDIEVVIVYDKLLICYAKLTSYIFVDNEFFKFNLLDSWRCIHMNDKFIVMLDCVNVNYNKKNINVFWRTDPSRKIGFKTLTLKSFKNRMNLIKLTLLFCKLRKLIG